MSNLLNTFINCLFPRYCLLCKKIDIGGKLLCAQCEVELPYLETHHCKQCAIPLADIEAIYCGACLGKTPAFDHTIALFEYKEPVTQFIARLKFNEKLVYGELLGYLLAQKIKRHYGSSELPQCLLPVPLHLKRLRKRGYNQALCLARPIAKILQMPLNYEDCIRHKATEAQSSLNARARKKNLVNAFSLTKPLNYQYVAIVDDVMTTGQTLHEFARMLKKNGVKRVDVWCGARA